MSVADMRPLSSSKRQHDESLEEKGSLSDLHYHSSPTINSHPSDPSAHANGWGHSFGQQFQAQPPATSAPSMPNASSHPGSYAASQSNYPLSSTEDALSPSSALYQNFLSPGMTPEDFPGDLSESASPSLGDIAWAQSFNHAPDSLDFSPDLSRSNDYSFNNLQSNQTTNRLPQHINPQALTPESSNIASPPTTQPMARSVRDAIHSAHPPSATVTAGNVLGSDRPSLRVDSQLTPARSGTSSNASPSDPIPPVTSPSILISSYNRGDSPSRNSTQRPRASSKRSMRSRPDPPQAKLEKMQTQESTSTTQEQGRRPSVMPDEREGYTGLDPTVRPDVYVPSLADLEESRRRAERNMDVVDWLDKSEQGSDADADAEETATLAKPSTGRPRAVSAGDKALGLGIVNDKQIPGPGALLDENSSDDEEASSDAVESSDSDSPPAQVVVQPPKEPESYFPPSINLQQDEPTEEDPLPRQFFRPTTWQDPFNGGNVEEDPNQPMTSREAMYRYEQASAKFETASRAATWGTRRRISESDIRSLLSDESSLRRLSITPLPSPGERSRKGSILGQALDSARGIMRKTSINKAKTPPPPSESSGGPSSDKKRDSNASTTTIRPIQRISSFGKPKSPPLNTSSAFMAIGGQMAAIGGSGSVGAPGVSPQPQQTRSIKRQRSRSEIPAKTSAPQGLAAQWTNLGGPPVARLATSPQTQAPPQSLSFQKTHLDVDVDDDDLDDEDDIMDEPGIRMDLKPHLASIVPDHEGFKTHGGVLNPRIQDFLLDRVATEQVRRYKKLVEHKVKHTQAVQRSNKCMSGDRCNKLGSGPKILEPRKSSKDPTATTQFAVSGDGSDDELVNEGGDPVTAASFPEGIPLPPVKRLPAEFECTLCFKVKKFQKPSDWTKHVHEDVQPFTCTFPHCTEPKSFKRKADWVRHENERHRQLEWWQCNIPDCSHICYRKDNFVQHLVREHKKPEPKTKPRGSVNKPENIQARETEEVWKLVDECHHETDKKPREEPCRFCGNVCNSWKRLTVHLARHMEQVSLPVLALVEQKTVSPETTISPVPPQVKPEMSASVSPAQAFPTDMSGATLFPVASAPVQQPSTTPPYPMINANAMQNGMMHHQPSSGSIPTQFYAPQAQSAMHLQHQYSGPETFGPIPTSHVDNVQTPTNLSPFSEQATYNLVSYDMNQSYSPVPSNAINNPSASTYPPPYNAVPRHFQQRPNSATPSHHSNGSNADFGMGSMSLSTGYNGPTSVPDQGMFHSPVEGNLGFSTPPSGDPHGAMNMNMGMGGFAMDSQGQFIGQEMGQGMGPGFMHPHGSPHGQGHNGQQGYGF